MPGRRGETRTENIYYNALCLGPSQTDPVVDGTRAVYDVTRARPVLDRPSDWYMSITRLTVNMNSAPVFICPIVPSQPNPLLTPWVVGIAHNGDWFPQNLLWQPELYIPSASDLGLIGYYWCYNLESLVSMINVAIAAAYAAFRTAYPLALQAAANQTPFVIYNPITHLFSWVWHPSWATVAPAVEPLTGTQARVGINFSFLSVFDGFRNLLVSEPNGEGSHYIFENTGDNLYTLEPTLAAGTRYTSQSYDASVLLSNVRKIVVTSNSIPVVPENVPATNPAGGESVNSGATATMPIVADFVPQYDSTSDIRTTVYYIPSAQYRLVNLQSDTPLNRIQLSFYWQTTDGTLYPILLARNAMVECKIAFLRKSLYDNYDVVEAVDSLQ
jgi:hypothetical protein